MFLIEVNTTGVLKMLHYVDWTSPFMVSLITTMIILTVVACFSAYYRKTRGYLMMFIAALAVSSDLVTEIFVDNYELFGLSPKLLSDNNYFTCIFWTIPTVIMLCILSTSLAVDVYQYSTKSE